MTDALAPERVVEGLSDVASGTALLVDAEAQVLDVVSRSRRDDHLDADADALAGRDVWDVLYGASEDGVREAIRASLASDDVRTVETETDGTDGTQYFRSRVTALTIGDDPRLLWFVEEVTERRRDQRERELLERVFEVSPVGVVVVEPGGEISLANERAEEILGLERDESTSRTYEQPEWNLTHDDGTPIAPDEHPVTQVLETGEPVFGFEHWIELPDGTRRWLSTHAAPLFDDGEVDRVVVGLDDATALKERAERIQWLVGTEDLADVGGFEIDVETGRIDATAGMSGLHDADEYGPTLDDVLDLYHPLARDELRSAVDACGETGAPFDLELRRRTSAGSERWVRISGERVERSGDRTVRGVVRDVTTAKEREQRLMVINRILRHNLRNKLNIISGNAERIRTTLSAFESDQDSLSTVVDELSQASAEPQVDLQRLQRLADEVADFQVEEARESATRIERASSSINSLAERFREFERAIRHDDLSEPVDVRSVVESLREEYAEAYPDATIEVTGDDAAITGKHMAVRLLFEIPLENALEYNDRASPSVSFDVDHSDAGEVTVRIADDGPGLPEMERRVLEHGEETPLQHGTGVSLWTLYWLKTRLGGDVSFSENEPRGTVVELTFPAHDAAEPDVGRVSR